MVVKENYWDFSQWILQSEKENTLAYCNYYTCYMKQLYEPRNRSSVKPHAQICKKKEN